MKVKSGGGSITILNDLDQIKAEAEEQENRMIAEEQRQLALARPGILEFRGVGQLFNKKRKIGTYCLGKYNLYERDWSKFNLKILVKGIFGRVVSLPFQPDFIECCNNQHLKLFLFHSSLL